VFDIWIYVMLSVRSVLNRYAFIVSQKYDVIKNYRREQSDFAEILAIQCKTKVKFLKPLSSVKFALPMPLQKFLHG
jgi:hypothetical protein